MVTVSTHIPKGIHLTPAAAQYIKQQLQKHPDAIGFRLGVKDAGCSNKKYTTAFAEKEELDDVVFHDHNIMILVSKSDLLYVAGTQIDYVTQDLFNTKLQFNNPQAVDECGCGESFNVSASV